MRTVRRLRLRFLLLTTLCVGSSIFLLIAPSKPGQAHQKYIRTQFSHFDVRVSYRANILLVDLGGIEPPSETPFSQLLTIIKVIYIKRNVDNYARTSKNRHPGILPHMDKANAEEKQE